jgi:hypothetical protein
MKLADGRRLLRPPVSPHRPLSKGGFMKVKSLAGHIGEEILVALSGPDSGTLQRARLHLVEITVFG